MKYNFKLENKYMIQKKRFGLCFPIVSNFNSGKNIFITNGFQNIGLMLDNWYMKYCMVWIIDSYFLHKRNQKANSIVHVHDTLHKGNKIWKTFEVYGKP